MGDYGKVLARFTAVRRGWTQFGEDYRCRERMRRGRLGLAARPGSPGSFGGARDFWFS